MPNGMRESKLPLRSILQNFINNVEALENRGDEIYEKEFLLYQSDDSKLKGLNYSWNLMCNSCGTYLNKVDLLPKLYWMPKLYHFTDLKKLTESLKSHPEYICAEGVKECNRRKNRYKDILPYNKSRVILQSYPGIPGSDYINANYVKGASGSKAYIASQGPLPNTVTDFWRMVVECDVQVIVMASNQTEGGKHKCECYWAELEGEEKQFGNVRVSFIKSKQISPDFLVRTLKIKYITDSNTEEERTICQFHYMLWPDHGVPDSVKPLLHMVRLVRDCQASETLPVLVHCSAGCGRTGTICAIDYVWGLLRTGKLCSEVNLLELVKEMRLQRIAMVQTLDQYSLLYQALKELFRDRLALIDSHPYENVSSDGVPLPHHYNTNDDYEDMSIELEGVDCVDSLGKAILETSQNRDTDDEKAPILILKDPPKGKKPESSQIAKPIVSKIEKEAKNLAQKMESQAIGLGLKGQKDLNVILTENLFPGLDLKESQPGVVDRSYGETEESCDGENYQSNAFICDFNPAIENSLNQGCNISVKSASNNIVSDKFSSPTRAIVQSAASDNNHSNNVQSSQHNEPKSSSFLRDSSPGSIPPVPPLRNKTPSPRGASKKQTSVSEVDQCKNKNLSRRPSIKILREIFESPTNDVLEENARSNGKKLYRSASSVTPRCKLSIHSKNEDHFQDGSGSLTLERRGNNVIYPVCPPPPIDDKNTGFDTIDSLLKSCKNENNTHFNDNTDNTNSNSSTHVRSDVNYYKPNVPKKNTVRSRKEERPSLPIKKSKSFRYANYDEPESQINNLNNGFSSLGRPKNNSKEPITIVEKTNNRELLDNCLNIKLKDDVLSSHKKHSELIPPLLGPRSPPGPPVQRKKTPSVISPSYTQTSGANRDKVSIKPNKKPAIPPKKFNYKPKFNEPKDEQAQQLNSSNFPKHPGGHTFADFPNLEQKSKILAPLRVENIPLSSPQMVLRSNKNPPKTELKPSERLNKIKLNESAHSSSFESDPVRLKAKIKGPDYENNEVISAYLNIDSNLANSSQILRDEKGKTSVTKSREVAVGENSVPVPLKRDIKTPAKYTNLDFVRRVERNFQPLQTMFDSSKEVDFGENSSYVDEVFETINYNVRKNQVNCPQKSNVKVDFNSNMDKLAKQVYEDCENYLSDQRSESNCQKNKEHSQMTPTITNKEIVENVKTKVFVPIQGLRTRERRNSYRQAINTLKSPSRNQNDNSKGYKNYCTGPRRNLNNMPNKYEKIWFENYPKKEFSNTALMNENCYLGDGKSGHLPYKIKDYNQIKTNAYNQNKWKSKEPIYANVPINLPQKSNSSENNVPYVGYRSHNKGDTVPRTPPHDFPKPPLFDKRPQYPNGSTQKFSPPVSPDFYNAVYRRANSDLTAARGRKAKNFSAPKTPYKLPPTYRQNQPPDGQNQPPDGHNQPHDRHNQPHDRQNQPPEGHNQPHDRHNQQLDRQNEPPDRQNQPLDRHNHPHDRQNQPPGRHNHPHDRQNQPPDSHNQLHDRHIQPLDRQTSANSPLMPRNVLPHYHDYRNIPPYKISPKVPQNKGNLPSPTYKTVPHFPKSSSKSYISPEASGVSGPVPRTRFNDLQYSENTVVLENKGARNRSPVKSINSFDNQKHTLDGKTFKERKLGEFCPPEGRFGQFCPSESSEDSSSIQKSSSASNILKKLKASTFKPSQNSSSQSSKSKNLKEISKNSEFSNPLPPPKSFSKAIGKIKNTSKHAAANFKSYLNSKLEVANSRLEIGDENSDAGSLGSRTRMQKFSNYQLQKSSSSPKMISLFTQVLQDPGDISLSDYENDRSENFDQNRRINEDKNEPFRKNKVKQQYL